MATSLGCCGPDRHFGGTRFFTLLKTERTPQSMAETIRQRGWAAPLDPCAGVETSSVLVHGAGAVGATGLWHGLLFPTGPVCRGKGMDTFGIGGNISILHGVCDCNDIGRGWMQDRFGTPKLIPLYQIPQSRHLPFSDCLLIHGM